jgi:phenylacetate-CoA ligase
MRIVLDEKPPRVVPPLKVRVEHSGNLSQEERDGLERDIVESMSRRLKIRPKILWAEPGSLDRSHYKGQTFEKAYEDN